MSPWALSTSSIWIDKTGIDQSSPEKTAAGVAAFPRILASCDKFVGLISPGYFRRLWCVYELSEFVLLHRKSLEGRLLVIGLDWPAWWNPLNWLRTPTLSKAEKS